MRKRLMMALAIGVLMTACDADDKYTTRYACNFVFFTQYHNTSVLTRALDNPGTFTTVNIQQKQGVTHLIVKPNDGQPGEDIALTSTLENNRVNYTNVGANQSLIVGKSNFNGLKAYDRQCPNCLDEYGGVNYPLEFDENDAVICNKCHRLYLLNSEGMPVSGQKGDQALLQYRVEYNGQQLYVHN